MLDVVVKGNIPKASSISDGGLRQCIGGGLERKQGPEKSRAE